LGVKLGVIAKLDTSFRQFFLSMSRRVRGEDQWVRFYMVIHEDRRLTILFMHYPAAALSQE
jgi:hypothetical protein